MTQYEILTTIQSGVTSSNTNSDTTSAWDIIGATFKAACGNDTWTGGGANSNWSTVGNWSLGAAPGVLNTAVFNGTSNKAVTVDVSTSVCGINVTSASTATITATSGVSVTVSTDVVLSSGTFDISNSSWTVGNNWTMNSNLTFTATGSTVAFNASASTNTYTITNAGKQFQKVVFSGGSTWNLADPMSVSTMTINAGA